MPRRRITGVATPWVGISWEVVDSDADIVGRVFNFLEARRVLFEPLNAQLFAYVGQSVHDIREMLTRELDAAPGAELRNYLQNIRSELRRFNTQLDQIEQSGTAGGAPSEVVRQWEVLARGEMRGRVSSSLAVLAQNYNIEVDEDLAAALQPADNEA
jgi:Family of unknown function (DUF6650)